MIISKYLFLYNSSGSFIPWYFSGNPRTDLERNLNSDTNIVNSHLCVLKTSPVTPIKSPISTIFSINLYAVIASSHSHKESTNFGSSAEVEISILQLSLWNITWIFSVPSIIVQKDNLPKLRYKISLHAVLTCFSGEIIIVSMSLISLFEYLVTIFSIDNSLLKC